MLVHKYVYLRSVSPAVKIMDHFSSILPFILTIPLVYTEGSLSRGQKEGLALDLGCAALAIKGQKVDVKLPLLKQG